MSNSPSLQAYIDRTERDKQERFAKARADGCPPGFEEEWATSSKFRMKVRDKRV